MIDRLEVETVLTLAEELHFGRTAERLHVSTARVSQTIRALERRVGTPLFERTSRRVALTPIGTQFVERLRPAWHDVQAAVRHAVDAGRGLTGTLRVGFVGPAAAQVLIRATEQFRHAVPGCEVQIREAQLAEVPELLSAGTVEVCLCPFSDALPATLARGPVLVREAFLLAVPTTHPWADLRELSVSDIGDTPTIQLAGAVNPVANPAAGPAAATLHEALTLVGVGRGVLPIGAHAQRYHARPDITYVILRDTPMLEWGLVWPTERSNARIRAFAEATVGSGVPSPYLSHGNS
ncbi:LysR family transcriptional regulator [Nocardia camponoti]|uniref:LysR family transcriptional regulator n=1 Tax=Nocardia camponoti TaxID=1616106 RepID=A0A917V4L7_9NOCA|nr:LysR family transcriptional regulator [Nocardia camponoti]GGK36899.1 LysR family transcriptional regulator [Nocardia camponoti]